MGTWVQRDPERETISLAEVMEGPRKRMRESLCAVPSVRVILSVFGFILSQDNVVNTFKNWSAEWPFKGQKIARERIQIAYLNAPEDLKMAVGMCNQLLPKRLPNSWNCNQSGSFGGTQRLG